MDLLCSASHFSTLRFTNIHSPLSPIRRHHFTVRSTLPFPAQNAKYHRELEAAVGVVERACRLCLDVKSSLFSSDGRVVEKNDQTPVTIADFGVQALVSLELGNLFPSIPLVAEEDSTFIRSNNLEDLVVNAVTGNSSFTESTCTEADVLQAIDRGGKDAFTFGTKPATYWVLDPIDGTRGFLKGSEALYVVGLALVVDGEIALGVMGCPNWQNEQSNKLGIIMVSHVGCGTWTKQSPFVLDGTTGVPSSWIRCFVDHCCIVHEARFCSQDSQSWDSLPLSPLFSATTDVDSVGENQVLLIPSCCGSLCKYLMVASGRASIFILRSKVDRIIKAWDHAVGMICVHEAGGKVSPLTTIFILNLNLCIFVIYSYDFHFYVSFVVSNLLQSQVELIKFRDLDLCIPPSSIQFPMFAKIFLRKLGC
ncbi:putative PAP-specific phosphatase, mitochondrial isoform X1 [Cannabis sativa]|uniref:putative PAP-specific phosphatase, mitochondrial isoform X1 n=1 Tax=Cannabis sativa TaxID=3483 RepID=UPI0029CA7B67|nr:putative PAP-specific phosphatase, mitochondrial isoform X1 [Cannabis sativa]